MKYLFILLGSLALALGVIGIFLPILPTTPLLLLAAALYFRSSPKLYEALLNHPQLGSYIRHFREHRSIPLRVKIVSVTLVWITLLYCAWGVAHHWALRLFFLLLAAGITLHILSYKTLRQQPNDATNGDERE